MSSSVNPLETAHGGDFAGVRQLSIFVENRVGQLLRMTKLLETERVRILGLSVDGKVDCAIVRMIVSDPDAATQMFAESGFPVSECEMLVVGLPQGRRGIMAICAALIGAEININYLYPLWADEDRPQSLAIQCENLPLAATVLREKSFTVLTQSDI
ncbi:MAG: acetolactate synthase [Phycisphaerae bacterium]|nr:acetolactate synthase [Phycisphaerae bacterium]